MQLQLRTARARTIQPAYPVRLSSFVASVAVHSIAIVLLALLPSHSAALLKTGARDQVVHLRAAYKITYYVFRRKLPEVAPLEKIGHSPRPLGAAVSRQAVIATSKRPRSRAQSIWLRAPKIELQHDIRVPDLVARIGSSLPVLPPPPPEKPHTQVKAFVPPPRVARQPRLPMPLAAVEITPALPLPSSSGTPLLSRASFPAPPAEAASAPGVDVAIASLVPTREATGELPEGDRPGRFSRAPTRGPTATGDVSGPSGLRVPNLSVQEDKRSSLETPESPQASKAVLYSEAVRNIPISTLSIPLRPSSRTIPAPVDLRFRGRNVYTLVVPIENFPEYAGDWIVWFAELEPKPGDTPLIRAPVPFRKLQVVREPAASGNRTGHRIMIAAILAKDGRPGAVSVLTRMEPGLEQAVIRDLLWWEFRPATRNGVPVDIEIVFEIPFIVPVALAK